MAKRILVVLIVLVIGGLMTVSVGTRQARPNHHLKLTGANNAGSATSLGLVLCNSKGEPDERGIRKSSYPQTALKISQGNSGYGDFEMPYTPIVQNNWQGGRGMEDFEKDTTRFYDSYRCDTSRGGIEAGPKETQATFSNAIDTLGNLHNNTTTGAGGWNYNKLATKFTVGGANFPMRSLKFYYGSGDDYIIPGVPKVVSMRSSIAYLYSHDAANNKPLTLLKTVNFVYPHNAGETLVTVPFVYTLTASTTYWVVWYMEIDYGTVMAAFEGTGLTYGISRYNTTLAAWTTWDDTLEPAFQISDHPTGKHKQFFYKGALYAIAGAADGGVPGLFMNGYRGVTADNASDLNKTNVTISLSGINLTNKIIQLVGGPGLQEEQPWRMIVSNSSSAINVSPAWNVAHGTTTEFVILGCDTWQEITSAATSTASAIKNLSTKLSKRVTDVLVVDDVVYIAQGSAQYICRLKLQTTGIWKDAHVDGTNYAEHLELIRDTTGNRKIWRAREAESQVSSASVGTWSDTADAATLSFGTAITCHSSNAQITNLLPYGNPELPWVLKEDSFGSINNSVYAPAPITEMKHARSDLNGKAAIQHDVYLYMSMLDGLERYYEQRMDNVGPNMDAGLPYNRRGPIVELIGYPGRLYAIVDGGDYGYSSILMRYQSGWHEIYRAGLGTRIYGAIIQTIPGISSEYSVDRLWVSEGNGIIWLPIAINPRVTPGYTYADGAYVISSWIYGGFKDVNKFWKSLSVFADNMSADTPITVYYQTDDELDTDAWHLISGVYDDEPEEEHDLSATHSVFGRRIRYKIVLTASADATQCARVNAVRIDSVTRVPPKNQWNITFLLEDSYLELNGIRTAITASSIESKLAAFADSKQYACPMQMESNLPLFDGKYVFVDPASFQLMEARKEGTPRGTFDRKVRAIGQFTVFEA